MYNSDFTLLSDLNGSNNTNGFGLNSNPMNNSHSQMNDSGDKDKEK